MKISFKNLFLLITILTLLVNVTPALAQSINQFSVNTEAARGNSKWLKTIGIPGGALIPGGCTDSKPTTPCGLNEVFQTIVNSTQILMAMTGSVMILMFVYGGTMMIVSGAPFSGKGDNRKTINKGKDAITAAIVGLIIILGAWLAINFTILALTEGEVGGQAKIFGRPFNVLPSGGESICQSGIVAPPGTDLCNPLCGAGGGTEGSLMPDGQVCCNCSN